MMGDRECASDLSMLPNDLSINIINTSVTYIISDQILLRNSWISSIWARFCSNSFSFCFLRASIWLESILLSFWMSCSWPSATGVYFIMSVCCCTDNSTSMIYLTRCSKSRNTSSGGEEGTLQEMVSKVSLSR